MLRFWTALCFFSLFAGAAQAQSRGTVILVPGSGGGTPNDFLVRNQHRYEATGFATRIAVGSSAVQSAAASARGGRLYAVGMSAGGPIWQRRLRAALGLIELSLCQVGISLPLLPQP